MWRTAITSTTITQALKITLTAFQICLLIILRIACKKNSLIVPYATVLLQKSPQPQISIRVSPAYIHQSCLLLARCASCSCTIYPGSLILHPGQLSSASAPYQYCTRHNTISVP